MHLREVNDPRVIAELNQPLIILSHQLLHQLSRHLDRVFVAMPVLKLQVLESVLCLLCRLVTSDQLAEEIEIC